MQDAISDSSTLIHLAGIGRLELLKVFYGKILITPAVWKEVVEGGENDPAPWRLERHMNQVGLR